MAALRDRAVVQQYRVNVGSRASALYGHQRKPTRELSSGAVKSGIRRLMATNYEVLGSRIAGLVPTKAGQLAGA